MCAGDSARLGTGDQGHGASDVQGGHSGTAPSHSRLERESEISSIFRDVCLLPRAVFGALGAAVLLAAYRLIDSKKQTRLDLSQHTYGSM